MLLMYIKTQKAVSKDLDRYVAGYKSKTNKQREMIWLNSDLYRQAIKADTDINIQVGRHTQVQTSLLPRQTNIKMKMHPRSHMQVRKGSK